LEEFWVSPQGEIAVLGLIPNDGYVSPVCPLAIKAQKMWALLDASNRHGEFGILAVSSAYVARRVPGSLGY